MKAIEEHYRRLPPGLMGTVVAWAFQCRGALTLSECRRPNDALKARDGLPEETGADADADEP